jgi:hypothetical protein
MKDKSIFCFPGICAAAIILGFFIMPASAKQDKIFLWCKVKDSSVEIEDERMKSIDKIMIDVEAQNIHFLSSEIKDGWSFGKRGYDKGIDWYDNLNIHEYTDGLILAGGIRYETAFGIKYDKNSSLLSYVSTDKKGIHHINFECKK